MAKITFTRKLKQINDFVDYETIKQKRFGDFTVPDLKKIGSDDFYHLDEKKIEEFFNVCLKTKEMLSEEGITRFEESEIKQMTQKMTNSFNISLYVFNS